MRPWSSLQTVPFIDTTVQIYNFAPLRGAFLSCFAKKGTKVRQKKATWGRRSDCAVVTLLRFGATPDSPNSPSPKTPSAQGISSTNQIENLGSHLLRCANMLHDTNRFLNNSINRNLPNCLPQQRHPYREKFKAVSKVSNYELSLRGHLWPWQSVSLKPSVLYQIPI